MNLYVETYEKSNYLDVPGMEIKILHPDMPDERDMINYDKKTVDQKWRRTHVPKDYRNWPWQKKKQFADEMWHRRWNGEWWLIKGQPIYISGTAFLYFNFWRYALNTYPGFAVQCTWFLNTMRHVERDPNVYGLMVLKPRRSFATEMGLCWGWDQITKYRDSKFGIMSKSDDDAEMAFDRGVFSAMGMPSFFKPKNTGSDRPQAILQYEYPARKIGTRNVNDVVDDTRTPELHSRMWFEPTVEGKFDGEKLRVSLFDEIGKIPVSKMDVFYQWRIMRECHSLNVGQDIIGKCIMPSTIEDLDSGKSIEVVQKFWDASNPKVLNDVGRTTSGMIRMFRDYTIAAATDEWGFPKSEAVRKHRNAELAGYINSGLEDEASDFKRKYPENVEEALAPPVSETILPSEIIDRQRKENAERPSSYPTKAIQGTLYWAGEFGGDVRWAPDPNGKWFISRHPDVPNQKTVMRGMAMPGNMDVFCMGVDPIDSMKPRSGGSDGAFTVGSLPDFVRDADMVFNGDDVLISDGMWGDACCCDYSNRPKTPEEFYEDALMTGIYFGCQMLVEMNKPGLVNWGYENNFGTYFAQKPRNADTQWMKKESRETIGASATTPLIDNYYRHLRSHMIRRYKNYTHNRLLEDLRRLTPDNRGDRDLAVSWGWCLTLMYGIIARKERNNRKGSRPDAPNKVFPITLHKINPR